MNDVKIGIFSEDVEYDLSQFDCGEESLNTFLTEHLKRQHRGKFFARLCPNDSRGKTARAGLLHALRKLF